ncbi:MAG TPA: stage II sporulation protein M [Ferruginibacter sp.]|nr:stage II sporulation protein M [Ferruginibacter sp.]
MREAMFIKKNVDKWNEYQHSPTDDPDETAERFMTLIDDVSYAKTFYPRSKVTRWVNGIAAGIYQSIYQNRKEKFSRVFQFWRIELPLLFRKYHKILLFTTLAFLLFTAIGVFSALQDEDFASGILGRNYVRMTEQNIENGDPFGVYKDDNPFTMFVLIGYNNIRVAFLSFIGGFTCGLTTIIVMWKNGLMLGVFHYLFFAKDLGMKSILVIWIHGTLEISSIVLSCAAGFIVANGILFPGSYTRMISFKQGVKDAAKVLLTLVPILVIAAFFEIYVTHLMSKHFEKGSDGGMPVWVSILILASSFAFITWYFVILPRLLKKKGYYLQPDGIINRVKDENA